MGDTLSELCFSFLKGGNSVLNMAIASTIFSKKKHRITGIVIRLNPFNEK